MTRKLSMFTVGDTVVRFDAPAQGKGAPQNPLHPKSLAPVKHREFLPPDVEIVGLPSCWQPVRAWAPDSLVQIKCANDHCGGAASQGRTMRAGPSTAALTFVGQSVRRKNGGFFKAGGTVDGKPVEWTSVLAAKTYPATWQAWRVGVPPATASRPFEAVIATRLPEDVTIEFRGHFIPDGSVS